MAPPQEPEVPPELQTLQELLATDKRRFVVDKDTVEIRFASATQILKTPKTQAPFEPTEQLASAICALVRGGHHPSIAAAALGIGYDLFDSWKERGWDDPDSVFGRLMQAIDVAAAQSEILNVERIATDPKSTNTQWLLERRIPERWGNRQTILNVNSDMRKPGAKDNRPMDVEIGAEVMQILEGVGYFEKLAPPKLLESGEESIGDTALSLDEALAQLKDTEPPLETLEEQQVKAQDTPKAAPTEDLVEKYLK